VGLGPGGYPVRMRKLLPCRCGRKTDGAHLPTAALSPNSREVKLKALEGAEFIIVEPDIPTAGAGQAFKDQRVTVAERVMEFDNVEPVKPRWR